MNRFARIMQVLGWLGVVALGVAAAGGYSVSGEPSTLARHTVAVVVATGPLLLAQLWTLCFLALSAGSRRSLADRSGETETAARSRRRRAIVTSLLAIGLLLATYFVASALLWRRLPPWVHGASAWATVFAQAIALITARRALVADQKAQERAAPAP